MEKQKYFGSVRFYKNMILVVVVLLILLGLLSSIFWRARYKKAIEKSDPTAPINTDYNVGSEVISYQDMYEDFYAPQDYRATVRTPGNAYLTFDGSSQSCAEEVLDVLDEKNVKATFFVTGDASKELLNEIIDRGHTIGMLSWSQNYNAIYASVEDYLADMYQMFNYIKESTGIVPTLFRFQGGSINSYNGGLYKELIAEMIRRGFVPFDWNVSVGDDANASLVSSDMVAAVQASLPTVDRALMLLHCYDGNDAMIEALPDIIDTLNDSGFSIEVLDAQTKPVLFAYTN